MLISSGVLSRGMLGIALFMASSASWSAAKVESLVGEVNASYSGKQTKLQAGQRLESGTTLSSLAGANAVLRFDDGQVVVINQNTEFKIVDYRYEAANPKQDRSVLELVRGALRFVSGALGKRSQNAVALNTGTATIGIRGTDFMAATGSLYLSVGQGAVSATNTVGSMGFSAGQLGFVAGPNLAPGFIAASQLPASIAASFGQLGAISVAGVSLPAASTGYAGAQAGGAAAGGAAAGGAAGVGGAAGAAVGGVGIGAAAVGLGAAIVGGVLGVAGNSGSDDGSSSTSTSTSTSTATSTR